MKNKNAKELAAIVVLLLSQDIESVLLGIHLFETTKVCTNLNKHYKFYSKDLYWPGWSSEIPAHISRLAWRDSDRMIPIKKENLPSMNNKAPSDFIYKVGYTLACWSMSRNKNKSVRDTSFSDILYPSNILKGF